MSVSKMLLDAIGKQDSYLSKESEFSFFKPSYKRHTNFAVNLSEILPNSKQDETTNHKFGSTVDFTIEKQGDLLLNLTLKMILQGNGWVSANIIDETLFGLIDFIEIQSNNKVIERLTGEWLYLYSTLYQKNNNKSNKSVVETTYASQSNKSNLTTDSNGNATTNEHSLHLYLPFWFCLDNNLSLPLCALQHETISLRLKLKNFSEISNSPSQANYIIKNIKLLGEFVELTNDEKMKFSGNPLEYVIEQSDFIGTNPIDLNVNQSKRFLIEIEKSPLTNEIIWFCKDRNLDTNNYFNFWLNNNVNNHKLDHFKTISILLNGNAVNPRMPASYYRLVQRFQYHKSQMSYQKNNLNDNNTLNYNCIYSYSFSLDPESIKSSGFLSTEKFNTVHLDLQALGSNAVQNKDLYVFVKKYNIIRIKNGHLEILSN